MIGMAAFIFSGFFSGVFVQTNLDRVRFHYPSIVIDGNSGVVTSNQTGNNEIVEVPR